jgi:hypothetical protein
MLIYYCLMMFQVKHFLCDFVWQNKYMLGKFKDYPDFILPLLAHSLVQAIGSLAVILMFAPAFWWLSIVDLVTHFMIDRLKANKKWLGRWKPDQAMFWTALGLDQMLHHLVTIYIVWRMFL